MSPTTSRVVLKQVSIVSSVFPESESHGSSNLKSQIPTRFKAWRCSLLSCCILRGLGSLQAAPPAEQGKKELGGKKSEGIPPHSASHVTQERFPTSPGPMNAGRAGLPYLDALTSPLASPPFLWGTLRLWLRPLTHPESRGVGEGNQSA